MGAYVPPNSSSDGNKGDGKGANNNSGGGPSIVIPNPSSFIPSNPSIGLKLWGPLVPASDNVTALSLLIALQVGVGILGFHKARSLRRSNLELMHIPNTWKRRVAKYAYIGGGSYLIFLGGLEISRLSLPYDPWYEEAKYYRRSAVKNGDQPSWWFGAFNYYKPMNFKTWSNKVEAWIKNASNVTSYDEIERSGSAFSEGGSPQTSILTSLAEKRRYSDIHKTIHETNLSRFRELLSSELKDITELNKAERIDKFLESESVSNVNGNYSKPHIQLGDHRIDTDDEFEMVWLNFEPWDELKVETDYDIKFIPRCRWPSDKDEVEGEIADEEVNITGPKLKDDTQNIGDVDNAYLNSSIE